MIESFCSTGLVRLVEQNDREGFESRYVEYPTPLFTVLLQYSSEKSKKTSISSNVQRFLKK
ncbi:hypothetical protein BpHYR1_030800 [Brachionus plicatilis]|uniref:Uncharacterized protein n=1 Tax=Brachionus plicatilis TaxID=10195 RepID=A0A3M7PR48_BRAPC|nr:hypothetical protein BpHYR1_030800 [Brachionus plicatilis]